VLSTALTLATEEGDVPQEALKDFAMAGELALRNNF